MNSIFKKKVFFIAEISGNHDQNFKKAKKIIKEISKTGADAIKFQTLQPDEMTLDSNKSYFRINEKSSIWSGQKLYNLYKKSAMPLEWQEELFDYSKKLGLIAFSTPFGIKSLNFLKKIKSPIYKIASLENSHFPLIKEIVKTKKPIILSTGSATLDEIEESVEFIKKQGCKDLTLLKCTSVYPAKFKDLNLNGIQTLKKKFNCRVGFSDHSQGIVGSMAAIALGAEVVEKHIKLNKSDKSIDAKFSITPGEMSELILNSNIIKQSLGDAKLFKTPSERFASRRRRSIFVVRDIKSKEKLTSENVKVLRPNKGMHPKYYFNILGKKVKINLKKGTPLKMNHLVKK